MRLNRLFLIVATFLICFIKISSGTYETWYPENVGRTDLLCPSDCNLRESSLGTYNSTNKCCVCNAVPSWQLYGDISFLKVEYVRRDGTVHLIGERENKTKLVHHKGFVTSLPTNICEFPNLVFVSLQNNKISTIGNISCLISLDTLDLSYNSIHFISNKTFTGLRNLRILNINNNYLATLEPFALVGTTLQIFRADLSSNNLTEIDISNLISEKYICKYDFSKNNITKMVNDANFSLNGNKTVYKCGFIDLNNNNFESFIDFVELGIDDITLLGRVLECGFSMQAMKWDCDCQMEPFLELASKVISRIWRDYFNLTCWNPPEYRNMSVPGFATKDDFLNDNLHLLICNMSEGEEGKCPRYCHCYVQPKLHRTVVNCTSIGLTKLPLYMPDKENLTILMANNSIEIFESRNYLNRTRVIDISDNLIRIFTEDAVSMLITDTVLTMNNNSFKKIPREFQKFDPCSKVRMGQVILDCDCKDIWIGDWAENRNVKQCNNLTEILCSTRNGQVSWIHLTWNDICGFENYDLFRILSILFSIALLVAVITSSVFYTFRFELSLIFRKVRSRDQRRVKPWLQYDVLVSFNEENETVRKWVIETLEPQLQLAGYKSCLPLRDTIPGTLKEDEMIYNINRSKNYIVILCDDYLGDQWKEKEWKYVWHSFHKNLDRNIVLVNFDQVETSDIVNSRLKAFLRLTLDIDFANRNNTFLEDIQDKLGPPMRYGRVLRNAKTKYVTKTEHVELNI
ncbi:Hypothetical predicted protein [Mytilus galloprovincialis]|uniref:TIR domain-containing protein n=1 Tax=Mytilus galloprovincialis TaxID=29158 RepID=A0A8B6D1Y0_MYTGA|nr:Hypothetical predicted protein [Mytilus galloprovincialis]